MKYIAIFRNLNDPADKGVAQNMFLSWILHQSMRNSFLRFVRKISKSHENYHFKRNSIRKHSLHSCGHESKATFGNELQPQLEKHAKSATLMIELLIFQHSNDKTILN